MANRRKNGRRRRRRNPLGAVIIVLAAVAAAMVIVVMIMNIRPSAPAPEVYPVKYTDEIYAAARENDIPAPYIAAVIMAESSYLPDAVSSVGAMGLMQIMPSTGEWIAGKYDEEFTAEMLYDPEVSIRYGAWYLGFLMDRYSGDMRCASAAYHAGQGTVDKWLEDPAYSQDGETLAVIAYDSTATYVDRILKYYDYYVKAYAELEASAETIE